MVFQNDIIAGASGAGGYTIDQSIRFNDNDSGYLYRTPSSASNRRTWTLSYWIKRANLGGFMNTFDARLDGSNYAKFQFHSGDYLQFLAETGGGGAYNLATTRLFRDPSAWYHIVLAVDTTQSTAADRVKIYVNGTQETSFISASYPAQNYDTFVNTTNGHALASNFGGAAFLDGYMAEINFVDGQQLDPSSFGEVNADTGQWIAKKYSGSYGTNGFYITGKTASDLGEDFSGNNNDWTSSGLAATDQMSDSPTNNFCTWSSIDTGSGTLSDGNLVLAGTTDRSGTFGMTSGKWAWKVTASANGAFGVVQGGLTGTESTYSALSGEVLEFQFDVDAGTLDVSVDNGAYTSVATGLTSGPYLPLAKAACSADFGQLGFSLDDADFNYLSTSSLPDPAIEYPPDYFTPYIYTGDDSGTSRVFTGVGFAPNLVWTKSRAIVNDHSLFDTVRGTGKYLSSSYVAGGEITNPSSGYLTAFGSDGYTFSDGSSLTNPRNNYNANSTYVSWNWNAPTTSTNTDGSVDTSLSVNQTSGFSIGTFDGTGANLTAGHGLGVAPDFIMATVRPNATNWNVYHSAIGNTGALRLNLTNVVSTSAQYWNNTSPTSTVITFGTNGSSNSSGNSTIFYAFTEVEGYSAFGSYVGNNNANGPMVNLGFQPSFIMLKDSSNAQGWAMYDTKRGPFNPVAASAQLLFANLSSASSGFSGNTIDIVSNGFKVRAAMATANINNAVITYAAFAENPFKTANAR